MELAQMLPKVIVVIKFGNILCQGLPMDRLLTALSQTSAYPEPTSEVRLIQTHVSFIFITDNFVYKIKKKVDFGFLDFSTLPKRRFFCAEEVRLNRRLCPDLYVGVAAVRQSKLGPSFSGSGPVIEYAVKMKRLPAEFMLDRLLAENRVGNDDIRRIARRIADFHNNAERGEEISLYGRREALEGNWEENFRQMEPYVGATISNKELAAIKQWVSSFLEERQQLFEVRVAQGYIRDCDGDIHSENICITPDQVYIFDCIEFNRRFRYSDTAADISFFLMDLDYHRQPRLGEVFIEEYLQRTKDHGALQLLDFYKIYRAFVRGKVESFQLSDPLIGNAEKEQAKKAAQQYFRLARGYILRQQLRPYLIMLCGLTGSGKSTISEELAFQLGISAINSDTVRKKIAGISLTTPVSVAYGEGLYSKERDLQVYGELLSMARKELQCGRSVIVDATFRRREHRQRFAEMAATESVEFGIIHTMCDDAQANERLRARALQPTTSDGRWEIYLAQKADFEPPMESEGKVLRLQTTQGIEKNMEQIFVFLGVTDDVA